jgi:hypothetical protein
VTGEDGEKTAIVSPVLSFGARSILCLLLDISLSILLILQIEKFFMSLNLDCNEKFYNDSIFY